MSDILERLRRYGQQIALCNEAADEIERLRAAAQAALEALEESVDLVQHTYDSDWRHGMPTRAGQLAAEKAALDAHKAAIDALRAALASNPATVSEMEAVDEPAFVTERGDGKSFVRFVTPLPTQQRKPLTPRELELIDGMIEVQLYHAFQCDRIPNRTMADKQKGWDMERVELLRKLRDAAEIGEMK